MSELVSCMDGSSADCVQSLVNHWWPGQKILDATYGNGSFWKGFAKLAMVTGLDSQMGKAKDIVADFRSMPFPDGAFPLVIYDPPFQPQTVSGIIGDRFSKPVSGIGQLRKLVEAGLQECWRVTNDGLIVKVQDYIHNHKPVWMSMWAHQCLGEPWDFVVLRSGKRKKLKAANWSRQLSVWRNHSTFWIYRKKGKR